MIANEVILQIGKTRVKFLCASKYWTGLIRKNYSYFLVKNSNQNTFTVTLHSLTAGHEAISGQVTVTERNGGYGISRNDFLSVSDKKYRDMVLFCSENRYSFDSWLRIFLTLIGINGSFVLAHSSGLRLGNSAYLFPGVSGRGKSTITRIFGKKNALSDEVVLIARGKAGISAYSTPFWGELKKGAARNFGCKLKGLYFIRHGDRLKAEKITAGQALQKLLASALFFSKKKNSISKLLSTAAAIAKSVPAYELSFSKKTKKEELFKLLKPGTCIRFAEPKRKSANYFHKNNSEHTLCGM